MKQQKEELTDLFCELVRIPSPSGKELAVGHYIQTWLQTVQLTSTFDQTGSINDSNSGNLSTVVKGTNGQPTLMFVAHMDTVEIGDTPVKPKVSSSGVISSEGDTILGADNKASVACLLLALAQIQSWETRPTVLGVFPSREETGKMGISLYKPNQKVDYVFTVDGNEPVGNFVYKALSHTTFTIDVFGTAAHAGNPVNGRNAIVAAAEFIRRSPIGIDSNGATMNIGNISGGAGTNVVPDNIHMNAEIRSFQSQGNQQRFKQLDKIKTQVEKDTGCRIEIQPGESLPPLSVSTQSPIVELAKKATKNQGLQFNLLEAHYTLEANFLAQMGYQVLNMTRGSRAPHSKEENITQDELLAAYNLILAVCKASIIG